MSIVDQQIEAAMATSFGSEPKGDVRPENAADDPSAVGVGGGTHGHRNYSPPAPSPDDDEGLRAFHGKQDPDHGKTVGPRGGTTTPKVYELTGKTKAIMDWLIANPGRGRRECAAYFGVTATWISYVVNSDVFKAEYERRRNELSANIDTGVAEHLSSLAVTGMELLEERMTRAPAAMADADVTKITDMALKNLGFGSTAPNGARVVNNFTVVESNMLAEARERIRINHEQKPAGEGAVVSSGDRQGNTVGDFAAEALPAPRQEEAIHAAEPDTVEVAILDQEAS